MNKILIALLLTISLSAKAEEGGKYDECIAIGDIAVRFMTIMQSGKSLPQALKDIRGDYTSEDGDNAAEVWANQTMERMYQSYYVVTGKKDKQEQVELYKKDQIRQCMFFVDKREKQLAEKNQPVLHN